MFHVALKLRLVDLNYNFECDWLIELSDNKLSNNKLADNNLASELVGNRSFLNESQSRKLNFYDYIDYPSETLKSDQYSVFSSAYLCIIVKISAEKKEIL